MKFALVLIAAIGTDNADGGDAFAWILDSNLTGADCVETLERVAPTFALMGDVVLQCEQMKGITK